MTHKKVIIIGAGISGIKTALDLYNGGVKDGLILEARDRLGGRLLSIDSTNSEIKGTRYDLGASWFHDSLHNPLFEKAIAKGNIKYYYDDGKHLYFSKDKKEIRTWEFEAVLEEMTTYTQLAFERNPERPDLSLKDLCMEYVQIYKDRLTSNQIKYGIAGVRMWAELWHGESWDKLSGRYCFADSGHLGRNVYVKNGYVSVFNNELHELPEDYRLKNIKLNTQVVKIDYSNRKKIAVHTKNGDIYTCEYLVSTIPQSLLTIKDKKDPCYVQWQPPFPSHISEVLPSVKFGSLGKVIMEFDHTFWPKDVDRFYGITDIVPNRKGKISAWEYPTIFVNYHSVAGTSTLVALTQNPLSQYIEDLNGPDKNKKIWEIFEPLVKTISDKYSIPSPKNIYHTPWNNDKYVRGSYAIAPVGTKDPSAVISAFCEGIEERIRFAGAETIDGSAGGCAHGGWFSGEREAKFILAKIKGEKVSARL
ncbi:corticosteroid binding protein [Scheffersomyces xylosifermentans]|uniref:corticosteroid binding protein n=1 Tax=Scheffersomyces xylosifermentans TaxID=1304137 RepID=UPI00315D54DB